MAAITSVTGRTWVFRDHDERLALTLAQRHRLPELIGRLLSCRGIKLDDADTFITPRLKEVMPDPFHLKDMDKAVTRIVDAVVNKQLITIFGDYDVDGATSTAVLKTYFQQLGVPVNHYIPDRMKEGYGPNSAAFKLLKEQGSDLVLTVDCGITAHEPLQTAHDHNLDVIVIDHHIGEPQLPPAVAVVNPNRFDEGSDYSYLAAVGVCFLLLVALSKRLTEAGYFQNKPKPDLLSLLDIVALGTVCDVVPLKGLNRAYVTQGLKVMAARRNIGIKALARIAGMDEAPNAYHLGFMLGPRINAGGRVGRSDLGAALLSSTDPSEVTAIAQELDGYNTERKAIEQTVLAEAIAQIEAGPERAFAVAVGESWHPGVIGIVASRLKDRYHRPSLVIAVENRIGKGSGRSISGIHLGNLVIAARQQGLLMNGGGHGMAAGLTVAKAQIPELLAFMEQQIADDIATKGITPTLTLDAALPLHGVTLPLLSKLEQLSPFGAGNPQPRFMLEDTKVVFAKVVGEKHVQCQLAPCDGGSHKVKAISFQAMGSDLGPLLLSSVGKPLKLAGTIKLDTWGGYNKPQVFIEDAAV